MCVVAGREWRPGLGTRCCAPHLRVAEARVVGSLYHVDHRARGGGGGGGRTGATCSRALARQRLPRRLVLGVQARLVPHPARRGLLALLRPQGREGVDVFRPPRGGRRLNDHRRHGRGVEVGAERLGAPRRGGVLLGRQLKRREHSRGGRRRARVGHEATHHRVDLVAGVLVPRGQIGLDGPWHGAGLAPRGLGRRHLHLGRRRARAAGGLVPRCRERRARVERVHEGRLGGGHGREQPRWAGRRRRARHRRRRRRPARQLPLPPRVENCFAEACERVVDLLRALGHATTTRNEVREHDR